MPQGSFALDGFSESPSERASWWGLAVLVVVGLYTYMDRQVIALQAEPIRQQLALGDTQFGLIQGAGGALVTALVGYPIGWLADRCDRRWVLAGCLAVWSAAVALCGAATSFTALLLASALVGAAEAGLLPIAYASIPEWFRGPRRQAANSTFVLLGRLSAGLVIAGCGWLIHAIDDWRSLLPEVLQAQPTWRLALWATALPGVLLAPMILTVPAIAGRRVPAARNPESPSDRVLTVLRDRGAAFAPICLGAGLLSLGAGAAGTFVPVAAARMWGVAPIEAGRGFGAAALAGAAGALLITVVLTRTTGLDRRPGTALRVASWAMCGAAALAPALPFASGPTLFFALYGLSLACVMTVVMLLPTALQPLCPAPVRVRLMSIFVGGTIVVGSLGPILVGAMSDGLGGSGRGLIVSMAAVALVAHAAAAALLARGARCCADAVAAEAAGTNRVAAVTTTL